MKFTYRLYLDVETNTWKSATVMYSDDVQAEKNYYKLAAADIDDANKAVAIIELLNEDGYPEKREKFIHEYQTEENI